MYDPTPPGQPQPGQNPYSEYQSGAQGAPPQQQYQWQGEQSSQSGQPTGGAPGQYPPYPPQQPYPQAAYNAGYPPQYVPGMNPTNPFAIASLICSILGISLLGIIFGHISLSQINRSRGYERGRGLALAGLIIGYVELAIGLLIVLAIVALIPAMSVPGPATP